MMPTFSPNDVLRVLSDRSIELMATTLLALGALATSWSGYQATLWNGTQLQQMAESARQRQCGSRNMGIAGQQQMLDVITFMSWLSARAAHEDKLTRYYEQRFRPEFRSAFQAWVATSPDSNPGAPPTPFNMSQYRSAKADEATRCDHDAEHLEARANHSNTASDRFTFTTVLFAVTLFFCGTVQTARSRDIRVLMLGIATIACAAGLVILVQLPRG